MGRDAHATLFLYTSGSLLRGKDTFPLGLDVASARGTSILSVAARASHLLLSPQAVLRYDSYQLNDPFMSSLFDEAKSC